MEEILIIKGEMADNTEAIYTKTKHEGITEMTVKVHLPDTRISKSIGRQG